MMKTLVVAVVLMASAPVLAAENGVDCGTIRIGTPAWPGVTLKTRTAEWLLSEIGYKVKVMQATPPIIYQSLSQNDLDVFFGQWMPTHRAMFKKFGKEASIDMIVSNIAGGNYTIGVPQYVYDKGVHSIKDLNKYKKKFDGKIYTMGPGSGGTQTIEKMIDDNYAGLGDWKAASSSIAAMMVEIGRHVKKHEWMVFLAWRPHPMNAMYNIAYLAGGEKYWGPDKGKVLVNTDTRKGYAWKCPNVGQFLENYVFTTKEQSTAMNYVRNGDMSNVEAGKKLIRDNPKLLDRWFGRSGNYTTGGIKTADGKKSAKQVISKALGISK